jgi:hypothetical protein
LPAYLPSDGLVGWWPFNGNANDESGNGNNGTVNGATMTTDRIGLANAALTFNGTSDFIQIQTQSEIDSSSDYTWSIWFNSPTSNYNGSFIGSYTWFLKLGHVSTPGIFYKDEQGNQQNNFYIQNYFNVFPTVNNWHNIVVRKTNNNIELFLDAIYIGSTVSYGYANFSPNHLTKFGNQYNDFYSGLLDDISVYNRALSQEEITALYTGEPVNPPTTCNPLPANLQNGLVGYWPFCGNANDESGNGNDGTVNGATLTEDRFGDTNAAYFFSGADCNTRIDATVNTNSINSSNQYTISLWVKKTGDGCIIHPRILEFYSPDDVGLFQINWDVVGNEILSVETGNETGEFQSISYYSSEWLNSWHNLTVTCDEDSLILYDNGVFASGVSYNGQPRLTTNGSFGRMNHPAFNTFQGSLDDIGIWNRALSAEEVQQLYTLNACTFTVYDTTHVTVYDTVTTYTTVTDTLIINTLITSLAPPANTNTIKVFPNPAGSFLTIDYGNFALMSGYQLRIENSLGQQVFQTNINQQSDTLSLATWGGNGLYFVHIVDPQGNTIDIRKIVLQ